jgi:AAA family ATP:ADP antiporter
MITSTRLDASFSTARRPALETLQAWGPFAVIRAGEGRSVAVFSTYAFVLLVSYYVLKTLREPLLLAQGSAELKSYANATIAGVLLLLVPLYAGLFRRLGGRRLFQILTAFFALSLAGLGALGASGVAIGFYYYVWVGVFGLTVLAQFWAHAAHAYGVERGQRLFPMIMIGSVSGGLVGPAVYSQAVVFLGAWNLIGVMVIVLLGTWALIGKMGTTAGSGSALVAPETPQPRAGLLGGFSLVLGDRYLLSLAVLTVLLNCVNTMGEYMLAELVLRHMDARIAADPTLERDAAIGTFYARYYFSVNLLTVSLQVLLVGRLFSTLGVRGTMLLLPVIAIVSYGLVAFLPVFALVRVVKIVENAADYSLMNTVRHALYLPLPVAHKYQGKTAIDTFFWRFGDLLQAGIVFAGLHWLGFEFRHFALLNMALASGWLLLALRIGRMYGHRAEHQCGTEPELCTDRQPRRDRRRFKRALATGAAACVAVALPVVATADTSTLFEDPSVLEVQLTMNLRALCRDPNGPGCEDVPAVLSVPTSSGAAMVEATVRSRGRWRTARCSFPALFLFFDRGTTPSERCGVAESLHPPTAMQMTAPRTSAAARFGC